MGQKVRDVMTIDPIVLEHTEPVTEAAQRMRDADVGDILVKGDGRLRGIVTDRDIVVRTIADGMDPAAVTIGDICTTDVTTVSPDDDVQTVIDLMRDHAVRRVPVMDGDVAVGIVSIGDLALERDPQSALGEISAAPADG